MQSTAEPQERKVPGVRYINEEEFEGKNNKIKVLKRMAMVTEILNFSSSDIGHSRGKVRFHRMNCIIVHHRMNNLTLFAK